MSETNAIETASKIVRLLRNIQSLQDVVSKGYVNIFGVDIPLTTETLALITTKITAMQTEVSDEIKKLTAV